MGGLIKTQLKLLSKSKSLIVCMIIAVALGITMTLIYNYFWEQRGDKIAMSYALMRQYGMNTELLDTALDSIPQNNLWSYVNIFFSDGGIWLISCCCGCAFLSSEYNMGTLKNPVSRGCKRWKVYFTKLLAGIIDVFLVALAYVGSGTITAAFVVKNNGTAGAGDIIVVMICYILLLIAMASFFMLLTVLFHRTGFSAAAAMTMWFATTTACGLAPRAASMTTMRTRFGISMMKTTSSISSTATVTIMNTAIMCAIMK